MLTTLEVLNAVNLGIAGSIPSQLGQLTKLKELYLQLNAPSFNTTIPWQVEALRPDPLRYVSVW